MNRMNLALPLIGAMMTASLAYAQTTPPAPTPAPAAQEPAATTNEATQPEGADCVDVGAADVGSEVARAPGDNASETEPVQGADSGTAPGGAGSTGWTGGTGGSDIGTSQAEELPTSPQEHPKVASGLDPISGETKVEGPKAPPPPPAPAPAAAPVAPAAEARAC